MGRQSGFVKKQNEDVEWIYLVREKAQWRDLVNAVINHQVPQRTYGNFDQLNHY
jgi:hypothetical protein